MIQVLLLAVTVRVSTTTQEKQEHALVKVNEGHVDKESFPTCNNSGKINLLSYRYQHCTTAQQCSTSLPPAAKLVIHEMCSLKRTCTVSKFPQAEAEINVTYQCLNKFEDFIDICDNTTKADNRRKHLLYGHRRNNSANYENCNCQITGNVGTFSVIISDVRLKSATSRTCIRNQLYANYQTFTCNATKNDYGSVFNQIVKENITQLFIKFDIIDSTVEPEMIYFRIEPKVSETDVTVTCHNTRRIAAAFNGSAFKKTTPKDEDSSSSMTATIAVVCGCAVALILVSVAVLMKYRTKNWKYIKWLSNLERLVERRIQHPREESNTRPPVQSIDDDEYVKLKKKKGAPESIKGNAAGFHEPSDSYYDPINNAKPVQKQINALEDIEDSTVYSYAEHQPEKRIIATQSSLSKPGDRKFTRVNGISNGDNAISKHVYVKLLPVEETAAGECCDSVQLDTDMKMKAMSASNLKKTAVFNANEVNKTTSSYSFAKEPCQASAIPPLSSQTPEEPVIYSTHNQYDSASANEMKVNPSRNYDHAKKRDICETSCASDDEHYDRIDGDRTPVKINPNYDKLSK